jgi:hypothetical protein
MAVREQTMSRSVSAQRLYIIGRSRYLAVFVAMLLLPGCAGFKGYPDRPTLQQDDLEKLKPEISADKIVDCLRMPGGPNESCRNNLVTARKYAIDLKFSEFEKNLFRETREVGFWATLVSLGLTGGATFAGLSTAHALSAVATGVTGTRAAYEREILAEKTVIAIATAMHANRVKLEVRIRQGLKRPIGEYPLGLGLSDLEDYYYAGTVLGALVGITESVGSEAKAAQRELTIVSGYSTEPAAEYLKAFLFDKSLSDEQRRQRIEQVRAEYGKLNVDITRFLGDLVSDPNLRTETEIVARKFRWPG